jgi:hypothetical protein
MQGTILAAIADLLALRLKAQTEISSMAKPLQAQPSLAATDSSPGSRSRDGASMMTFSILVLTRVRTITKS